MCIRDRVYAWDYSETEGWVGFINADGVFAETSGGSIYSTPAVADIDNDGNLEVVVGTTAQKVYVWRILYDETSGYSVELVSGWPKDTGSYQDVQGSPVLADLDNDGDLEIIVAGLWGYLFAWDHNGVGLIDLFGIDGLLAGGTGNINSSPAVGDLDNDGLEEIVVALGYDIYAWSYDYINNQTIGLGNIGGTDGLLYQTSGVIYSSPALADIDGDGFLEIIFGSDNDRLYAINYDGTDVEAWPDETAGWPRIGLGNDVSSSPAVANIIDYPTAGFEEYSQDLEVVVGVEDGSLYAFQHDGKQVAGSWPVDRTDDLMSFEHDSSPTIADIDNDGDLEVIIGCWDGKLYAYNADASSVSGWPLPSDPDAMGPIDYSSPTIGLLDSTEYLDVAIGSTDTTIYTWDLNGLYAADALPWVKFRHDLQNTGTYQRPDRAVPTIDAISPISVEAGDTVNLTIQAHDYGTAPLDIIDISAYDMPTGASFSYNDVTESATFSWITTSADVSATPYEPFFIATDYYGLHSVRAYASIAVRERSNAAPIANDDAYEVDEDGTLTVPVPGVLGNDEDENPTLLEAHDASTPSNGTLVEFKPDGSFIYDPDDDWNGTDSFTYKAYDGDLYSETAATVTITVNSICDAPVANPDGPYDATEDTLLSVNAANGVLANDTNPEPGSLTAVLTSATTDGDLTLNADGSFTYDPDNDFYGSDSFTYKARNDCGEESAVVQVDIDVAPVNDPPVVGAVGDQTLEEWEVITKSITITDPDGDAIDMASVGIINNPGFISIEYVSGDTWDVTIAPESGDVGTYNGIKIKATDTGTPALTGYSPEFTVVVNPCACRVHLYDQSDVEVACFPTIQLAIDHAFDDYTAVADPWTYVENITIDKDMTVKSTDPENPAIVSTTIIDGDETYTVVGIGGNGTNATIEGFTITNGLGTVDSGCTPAGGHAGGIYCWQASPMIRNNVITSNNGPGIHCDDNSSPTITHNEIVDNINGAGIRCSNSSSPTITNNTISGNQPDPSGQGICGGGIKCASNSSPRIENNIITNNESYSGAGIYCNFDSLFSSNFFCITFLKLIFTYSKSSFCPEINFDFNHCSCHFFRVN